MPLNRSGMPSAILQSLLVVKINQKTIFFTLVSHQHIRQQWTGRCVVRGSTVVHWLEPLHTETKSGNHGTRWFLAKSPQV